MKKLPRVIGPESLSPRELRYYQETWGFNPLGDKINGPTLPLGWRPQLMPGFYEHNDISPDEYPELLSKPVREVIPPPDPDESPEYYVWPLVYHYEAGIPLENDPELQAAGVTVQVRVDVDVRGEIKNRVIFTRGDQSAEFRCVHTIVYAAPAHEVFDLSDKRFFDLSDERIEALARAPRGNRAILPPWEHFIALKSYVAGIAAAGFLDAINVLRGNGENHSSLPLLREDSEMFEFFRKTLFKVAANAMISRFMRNLGDLFESMPVQWLVEHWWTLSDNYNTYKVLAHVSYWDALPAFVREKVREVVRIVNKPILERYPNLADAALDELAIPNVNLLPGTFIAIEPTQENDFYYDRKFNGSVSRERVYDVHEHPKVPFIYPQILVSGRDNSIYYQESVNEEHPIRVGGGKDFAKLCEVAEKMAAMDDAALHEAAVRCRKSGGYFCDHLAEIDPAAARTIMSQIVPEQAWWFNRDT